MDEQLLRTHRLCGFAIVVAKFRSDLLAQSGKQAGVPECVPASDLGFGSCNKGAHGSGCAQLVGTECTLQGQGSEVYVRIEDSGLLLSPLAAEDVIVHEERGGKTILPKEIPASSPQVDDPVSSNDCKGVDEVSVEPVQTVVEGAGSSVKRKRGAVGNGNGGGDGFMHQLQWLMAKNNARVHGRILTIVRKGDEKRVVLMLDFYLPPLVWTESGFWKSGSQAAAALSHLSCDWEKRRMLLSKLKDGEEITFVENIWEQGTCHVLGCRLHQIMSESGKARFDLHSLFKSLPSYKTEDRPDGLKLLRDDDKENCHAGLWDMPDEIITSIFSRLLPKDLHNVAAVCRYTRLMAVPIMPCMHLRLFPHQQAAVRWMLQRENNPGVVSHSLCRKMETEDGFPFYLDTVSGELSPEAPPEVHDFRGGLFCDEPGLGKTVTALSLILKTQGATSDPPPHTEVYWIPQGSGDKMGYYEVNASASLLGGSALKRSMYLKARKNQEFAWESSRGSARRSSSEFVASPDLSANSLATPSTLPISEVDCGHIRQPASADESMTPELSLSVSQSTRLSRRRTAGSTSLSGNANLRTTRSSIRIKRKLGESFEMALEDSLLDVKAGECKRVRKGRQVLESGSPPGIGLGLKLPDKEKFVIPDCVSVRKSIKSKETVSKWIYEEEFWVQCEACSKWRKLPSGASRPKDTVAWFCSLNTDPMYQECTIPEETSDHSASVKSLPGFYKDGTVPGQPQNVAFFSSVIKQHAHLYDEHARRPVMWLANLNRDKLAKLATVGLAVPREARGDSFMVETSNCDALLKLFGLQHKKPKKGAVKWFYPKGLDSLTFDTVALKEAALKPRDDATRLYLSRATLIVVTQSLVDHWKFQIAKHTTPGQLRVYVWTDHKKPAAAHTLAWDYDIVITTFNRLSSEWSIRENSVLMRIHWLRVMLDEGHTLGASLSLTNKLQMAIALHASRRWILTGTPTPNTPSSQAAHLRPMLEFLHEGFYSKQQKLWDNAILRPFEAGREEGRSRLTQLLYRTMISSRKSDLCTIPPCIRKVKLLDFTEAHAATYNELVVTIQRNILLADWRDPSHVESLLNPKQWKFRSTTLRNTRLSCCVAGHIKVGMSGEDVHETMDLLVKDYNLLPSSDLFYKIQSALIHGGNCDRCREWCRLPAITPCCHLLCLSCVALDCEKCTLPGCGHAYKMQSPAELARPENPTPKWSVPQDLIELQPSYAQDDWDPDWHATSSSKVAYVVDQLKVIQDNNLLSKPSRESLLISRFHESKPVTWEAFSDIIKRYSLPEKAIVFSQFLEHIHVIEEQLKGAGIRHVGMYSPMHSANKVKSLHTFQNDPGCTVLVMDGSAALGLDLSFVTHVYLMEPIWDGSMEEQVVSRAHRMGATRPVLVETLAMRGTIEQQMMEYLQDPSGKVRLRDGHDPSNRANYSLENSYLLCMDFVRTGTATTTA